MQILARYILCTVALSLCSIAAADLVIDARLTTVAVSVSSIDNDFSFVSVQAQVLLANPFARDLEIGQCEVQRYRVWHQNKVVADASPTLIIEGRPRLSQLRRKTRVSQSITTAMPVSKQVLHSVPIRLEMMLNCQGSVSAVVSIEPSILERAVSKQ
jgi:hypothetical protein